MWDGAAGGLIGGGGSINAGRKPGEGMWQVGETCHGDEPVFLADARMLMPDGSALPVDEEGRVLPPDNTPPIPSGPTRVVLPDGRVLVADVGQESDGRRVVVMPDGHVYGSGARGRVLPTDERGVLVADGAHGRMIVDIGGVPKAVAGGSSSSGRARSSEGLEGELGECLCYRFLTTLMQRFRTWTAMVGDSTPRIELSCRNCAATKARGRRSS